MAIVKRILDNSGSGKEFESVTTSEITYDTTPQLGSFNPVTSDGVAKAISGASGEVPAVNPGDAGKVLTAGFDGDTPTVSWEEAQGSEYTAGNGIAINDSGVVSVNHDATLADKAPTRTLTPNYTQHAIVDKGYWYALEYDLTGVDASDTVTFKFGGPYGYDQSGSITMSICDSDQGWLYPEDYGAIRLIMAKPTGESLVGQTEVALGTSNVGRGSLVYGGVSLPMEVTGVVSSLFSLGGRTLDDFRDENGKVLIYLGVYNSDDGEWNTAPACHGPLGSLGRYAVVQLGYSKDYEVDWDTLDYSNVKGALDVPAGAAQLYVANPVPAYTSSEDGKVLGVVDNSGTASLRWVDTGTTYVIGVSSSVSLYADNQVVTNIVSDVTDITVGADVHSAIVQWVVSSTTTLPTVTDSNNVALKASVNNPASLTVGRTVQVSILNGTWVCAEFA